MLALHPNLPDEATPQWLGIQMPVARSSRPAGAARPSEGSRPAAGSEGATPAARAGQGPMPVNEEWILMEAMSFLKTERLTEKVFWPWNVQ